MTQSSGKRDTKTKSHPSVKLAPVRVFSCKHPLTLDYIVITSYTAISNVHGRKRKDRKQEPITSLRNRLLPQAIVGSSW